MDDPMASELRTRMPVTPTGLEQMRFDYAWKWFNFHAEQRTKMFNFMLIGMGIFATALVAAIDKKLLLEAALVSSTAVIVAIVFCAIDKRNKELYTAAMDVLIDAEKTVVFGDTKFQNHHDEEKTFGVSRRIAVDDGPKTKTLREHASGMYKGQHRYWMPFIALGFMTLFAVAALRSWLIYFEAVPRWPVSIVGVLVAGVGVLGLVFAKRKPWHYAAVVAGAIAVAVAQCVPALSRPAKPNSSLDVIVGSDLSSVMDLRIKQPMDAAGRAEVGMLASAGFGPFASGADSIDCGSPANVQAAADIRSALADAQQRQQRVLLLLVGATDRTPLSAALRQRYGSDAGLARARVSAVERCLTTPGTTQTAWDVVRVISGPAYTPASPAASTVVRQGMADDRIVRAVLVGVKAGG